MNENNPYSNLSAQPAALVAADERATFLKKVYGILFLGVLGFAFTLYATATIPELRDLAMRFGRLIYGRGIVGMLIYMGIFLGGSMAVHALAERRPVNAIAYSVWVVLLGFMVAPIVLITSQAHGVEIVTQASTLTALVFGALTAIVFFTGKDFSWLRSVLQIGFFAVMACIVIGIFTGFTFGLWLSGAIVLLFAGYILYDTSVIMHHLPTSMPMTGAILLFTDVVLLFKHILILLASSRD